MGYRIGGKQKTLAFGVYPAVTLAQARAQRDAAKKILGDNGDPSVQRKLDKQARGITFRLVADELIEKMKREGRAQATLTKTRWLLEFAFDVIGDRPLAKVNATSFSLCCAKSRNAETMRLHEGYAAPAAWCFGMALRPGGQNVIHPPIYVVR
jgi:hypothetical protein